MNNEWIERKQGDPKPVLKRSQTVEVEKRNGHIQRELAGCVDWRWLKISSDTVRYRVAPNEVKP